MVLGWDSNPWPSDHESNVLPSERPLHPLTSLGGSLLIKTTLPSRSVAIDEFLCVSATQGLDSLEDAVDVKAAELVRAELALMSDIYGDSQPKKLSSTRHRLHSTSSSAISLSWVWGLVTVLPSLHHIECMRCRLLWSLFSRHGASASLLVTHLCHAKRAERIEVLFGVKILGGPSNAVSDLSPGPVVGKGSLRKCTLYCI